MILLILGVIDLLASAFLLVSLIGIQAPFPILATLGIILLLKGLWSLATSSYFAGIIDAIVGILLVLLSYGIETHYVLVVIFGVILLIKALQSIIFTFVS